MTGPQRKRTPRKSAPQDPVQSPPRDPPQDPPQGPPPSPDEPAIRQLIFDNADGILVVHPAGVVLFANAAASRLLRPEGSPLVGTDFGHPAVAGEVTEIDIPMTRSVAEMRVSTIVWEGTPALLASLREITERRLAERSRQQLAAIVESSTDAITGLNAHGNIETWNAGAERLYGYLRSEMLGRSILTLAAPDTVRTREGALARLLSSGRGELVETRDRRKDGSLVDVSVTSSPIRDAGGGVVGVARVARDISEQKRLERELTFLADHDPLTGLFNRRRLGDELAHQCALAARYGDTSALLLGDLDHFKDINDSWGHQAGDEVIKRVARAIIDRLRDTDVPARLGGDEFAVLLPRTSLEGAQRTAESLCEAVEAVGVPIRGDTIRVKISFGVAVLEEQVVSPEDALAAADLAMYEAKRKGRSLVVAVHAGPGQEPTEGVAVSERLRAALIGQKFELHAQPVVHLATGALSQYELLLRLRQDGELLPPEAFLSAAERSGMIGDLDRWVVDHALDALGRQGSDDPVLSVNLSGASIGDDDLLEFIRHGIHERGIASGLLNVELPEAATVTQIDTARHFIEGLHHAGCSVALDGFGSGLGSFHQLRYLPVDYLKIDGDLVRRLPRSNIDRLVVKAITDVARGLRKHTIAEHVSSDAALALLREYGVEYGQGFLLGRPRPLPVPDRTGPDQRS
jgi:diguanylate cyclase (GGDEF)-like protein/PAS domain S-box-containing protein